MNGKTLKALKASIKHWEENVAAKLPEQISVEDSECALCAKFDCGICSGCPVAEKTGLIGCNGSPYREAADAHSDWLAGLGTRHRWRKKASAEVEFLKLLLPKEA